MSWYENAVFYELYTRSFKDGNKDGFGDFLGAYEKLDYLAELGIDAVWFPPFYASPLRDGGYDISDYRAIDERYGTFRDFERIIRKAHALGMHIMTDLVVNHTSDEHYWFEQSRKDPSGPYGDYYVWADDDSGYAGTKIIFSDAEPSNWTFDPVRGQYYWHRFYKEQPDLNFDCPAVHREILDIVNFWTKRGVDGFRLDAIPYLYEREGTANESLPETHAFLADLRAHLNLNHPDVCLLAEATSPLPENIEYFGTADKPEVQMCFNFNLTTEFFRSAGLHDGRGFAEKAAAVFGAADSLPGGAVWSNFLRNHDFLTLELVDGEERRVLSELYAPPPPYGIGAGGIARRLGPLFGYDQKIIRALTALLVSLPGAPCWYYGDEILMADDPSLPDRDSVRLPLPWEKVAADAADPDSFLNWFRQTLAYRKTRPALLFGDFEVLGAAGAGVQGAASAAGGEPKELFRFKRTTSAGDTVTFMIDFRTFEYSWS
ncbi:MAG: trehalose synthase [Clostridiales Family XIII bacterium]|jgi:maltose alpha-D-glucosyltransferase/alpha-amylase|nr:trehalose synthase [Clostridiales Family XIII bacterium]